MEALEKDFQELVASEDSTVEDEILQGILEPTVAEEEVLDDETEEILAEDEDAWEDPDQDDLEAYTELIAELKAENPDINFDNVEIEISEDGDVEIYDLAELKIIKRLKGAAKRLAQKAYEKLKRKPGYAAKAAKAQKKYRQKTKNKKIPKAKVIGSADPALVADPDARLHRLHGRFVF